MTVDLEEGERLLADSQRPFVQPNKTPAANEADKIKARAKFTQWAAVNAAELLSLAMKAEELKQRLAAVTAERERLAAWAADRRDRAARLEYALAEARKDAKQWNAYIATLMARLN